MPRPLPVSPPPSRPPLTLLLDEKLEKEVDTLAGVAPGDRILVPAEQHQQAYLVAQHGRRGLFLGRAGSERSQARLLGVICTVPPNFPPVSIHSVGSASAKSFSLQLRGGPSPLGLRFPHL